MAQVLHNEVRKEVSAMPNLFPCQLAKEFLMMAEIPP
jgi:hypothetical protein